MNAILGSGSGSSSSDDFVLQNLPSVTVAHALDPQPGDTILDMCCAPGGKASHLASRLCRMDRSNNNINNDNRKNSNGDNDKNSRNDAAATIIVACDKSRHKMVQARKLFERLGCYGNNTTNGPTITPLALDTTQCVLVVGSGERVQTVAEVRADGWCCLMSDTSVIVVVTLTTNESMNESLTHPADCFLLASLVLLALDPRGCGTIRQGRTSQRQGILPRIL